MKKLSVSRRFNLFSVVIYLVIFSQLASCKKDSEIAQITVPLKASFQTVTTMLQAGPPELDSIAGNGTGTPMGNSTFIVHAQFDESYNLTGKIVTTTENGDQFFANITGDAPDIDDHGNITLHFDAIIAGGTGKYAHATGTFSGIAHETFTSPAGAATWEGTITY